MKKVIVLSLVTLFFFGCTDYKSKYETLEKDHDLMLKESASRDSSINAFIETINIIDSGMKEITARQMMVSSENTTNNPTDDAKTRILDNMQLIDKMLQENREKLAQLQSITQKLQKANVKIIYLQKIINTREMELASRDSQMVILNDKIAGLNMAVGNLNATIDTMSDESKTKSKSIDDKTKTINTGYYITGTYKELYAKGILLKQGGFMGMGKSEMLKKDFDRKAFTKVDIREFVSLPLNVKKAELISIHPSNSYKMNKDAKKSVTDITVTNSEEFWSVSKYLVIMTEK